MTFHTGQYSSSLEINTSLGTYFVRSYLNAVMTCKEARLNSRSINFKQYKKDTEVAGVSKYAILEDGIVLAFRGKKEYYLYSFMKPGKKDVDEMKARAIKGEKLSTYVSQVVDERYDEKWIPD